MRFRFWFHTCKVAPILLLFGAGFFQPRGSVLNTIGIIGLAIFALIGLIGAVLGVIAIFGKLRMKCPFCGQNGNVGGDASQGLVLWCEQCGVVRGHGFLRLSLVCEENEEED